MWFVKKKTSKLIYSLVYNLVRVINSSIDETCESCIKRHGICLDENFDDRMDKCFCPLDNDLCNERSTTYFLPVTLSLRKKYVKSFHVKNDT